jgi:hypothetical protein
MVQIGLGKKQDPISKIATEKKEAAGRMPQVVKCHLTSVKL